MEHGYYSRSSVGKKLSKDFFLQATEVVAQQLLGCTLNRRLPNGEVLSARIAETEAYHSDDPACHAFKGPSKRNQSMFSHGGKFYVYLIYGMYYCLNVVTRPEGCGEAVLIRALQPLDGSKDKKLMGPGRLCNAFQIDKTFDGVSCSSDSLWIERGKFPEIKIKTAPRVGLNPKLGKTTMSKYRYYLPGMSTVKE